MFTSSFTVINHQHSVHRSFHLQNNSCYFALKCCCVLTLLLYPLSLSLPWSIETIVNKDVVISAASTMDFCLGDC